MSEQQGSIKIIIGAASDTRSVEDVFGSIEKRAQKAAQTIGKSLGQSFGGSSTGGGGSGRGFDAAAAAARKAERDIEKEIANQVKATKQASREMMREYEKGARSHVRAEQEASRDIIRNFRDITRARKKELDDQAREEKRANDASRRIGNRMGMYATRNLFPNVTNPMHIAGRIGHDLLRGAGVDASLSGSLSRVVQMGSGSVQLANQERIATGSTIGAGAWNNVSRGIGEKYSADSNNVQEMLIAFTAKTGKFGAAKDIGDQLAGMSVAAGANMKDMGNAAGYIYNQLQKLPDAGERTVKVMRAIVGQAAVGAVDMPDYAVQLGRIAANASKFEGNVDDNIRKQSALAQLAVEAGGASSPADAARAVASFSNTFGKHARISAFENIKAPGYEHGINLFADKDQRVLRDPFEIIKDSFKATKGNIPLLSNLFADTLGRKPVTALGNAYNAAGGGDAGIEAIKGQFKKYMDAIMTKEVEAQNIKDYQDSTAAKAQKFNNSLDKIVLTMADRVFPALEKLAPSALSAADSLAKLVSWAAENPIAGLGAAIVAAIAQAGIQTAVRTSFEGVIGKSGDLGIALGLVATAAMALAAYIDNDVADRDKSQRHDSDTNANAGVIEGRTSEEARKFGTYSPENKKNLEDINKNLEFRIKSASNIPEYDKSIGGAPTSEVGMAAENLLRPDVTRARQDAHHLAELKAELESNKAVLERMRTGILKVNIVQSVPIPGTSPTPGTKPDEPGRSHDPNKPKRY